MSKTQKPDKYSLSQRRLHVIGQCNAGDFEYLDHLVLETKKPDFVLDTAHLKNKHVLAFVFLKMCFDKDIPFQLIKDVVQEVLFWGYESGESERIEIRVVRNEKLIPQITLFRTLWDKKKSKGGKIMKEVII